MMLTINITVCKWLSKNTSMTSIRILEDMSCFIKYIFIYLFIYLFIIYIYFLFFVILKTLFSICRGCNSIESDLVLPIIYSCSSKVNLFHLFKSSYQIWCNIYELPSLLSVLLIRGFNKAALWVPSMKPSAPLKSKFLNPCNSWIILCVIGFNN